MYVAQMLIKQYSVTSVNQEAAVVTYISALPE